MRMKIPEINKKEGLVGYAERLSGLYTLDSSPEQRKKRGQFFTPTQVSLYMARLFNINNDKIYLLDPGAGTGALTAAFCERLLESSKTVNLTIDVFEIDSNLLPLLKKILTWIKRRMERAGHNVAYNIYKQDFILENNGYFNQDMFWSLDEHIMYDFVIANPPYYKLGKSTPQSSAMLDLVSGQPNIYSFFMALSASMLKPGGEMVFITPRSFCSGLYYKRFRNWFLENMNIENIHLFESRNGVFNNGEVLQENIIIKAKKNLKPKNKLTISVSQNKEFTRLQKLRLPTSDVIFRHKKESFIRIPTSFIDVEVLHIVDNWPCTLRDYGLEVSTGPVVPFRAKEFLIPEVIKSPKSVPLLWMHNIDEMRVVWPLSRNNKPEAIKLCSESMPILLPVRNYVLLKRFSSKEQRRRLYAAVFLENEFPYDLVGIENHVNYIHSSKRNLTAQEALGIAALLNSKIIDNYFRSLNGNTQVNATEIRELPLPEIEAVEEIGRVVYKFLDREKEINVDEIISSVICIDEKVNNLLRKGEAVYGKG